MSSTFFSQYWYRVAQLRLRLRSHTQIHRHRFRGRVWHVLQDHQSGRFHRLSPAAHLLVCLLNGRRSVNEAWELVGKELGDDQPSQDETIRLLSQLHQADLLRGDLPPDLDELARRSDRGQRRKLLQQIRNPLAIRIPAVDPERLLQATSWLVAPVFTRAGLLIWLLLIGWGLVLAVDHWPELTHNVVDRVLSANNLLQLLLLYPLIKLVHEFGHAYAVKRWGGEVHEIGIMLLVLMPVPYVDASTSTAFRSRWQRATVAGAGIMTEMLIAALAMMLWVQVEEGLVRALAFNTMLIAGVSTLLFNGNPLLRFDGYYVLCDLIDIPNLGTRANRYIFYLLQRYLLRIRDAQSPVSAPGERGWFVGYAISSFAYRVLIMYGIAIFLISTFMILGVVLAIWAAFTMFVVPLFKGIRFLVTSPQLHNRRGTAFASVGGAVALLVVPFVAIPVPYATIAEGVVWLPEDAAVRTNTEGIIRSLHAEAGDTVAKGDPLATLDEPILAARIRVLEAERAELALRLDATKFVDRVQADLLRAQLRHTDASLARERERADDSTIRAPGNGRFVVMNPADLPGRFVERGALIGYVVGGDDRVVRVVVDQNDIDLVHHRTEAVTVRFVEDLGVVTSAVIEREVPAASQELPGGALGTVGGGEQAVDPTTPDGLRAFKPLFQFDLRISENFPRDTLAGHAYARFDHGAEPIAYQVYRALRQLFLRQFSV